MKINELRSEYNKQKCFQAVKDNNASAVYCAIEREGTIFHATEDVSVLVVSHATENVSVLAVTHATGCDSASGILCYRT